MSAALDQSCQHSALMYDASEHLQAAAVPLLAGALATGEAVVLSCGAERNRLLLEALSGDERIVVLDHT